MNNRILWLSVFGLLGLLVANAGCSYVNSNDDAVINAMSDIDCDCSELAVDQEDAISVADIREAQLWGNELSVVGVKRLYISAQPDSAALVDARRHDVGVIINLRESEEQTWDEARAASKEGLTYYNVPIARKGTSFDQNAMKRISTLVQQHPNEKILLHCSSGNRAAAWLAIHLTNDHGIAIENSIVLAKMAGLTNAGVESRVRHYSIDEKGGEIE